MATPEIHAYLEARRKYLDLVRQNAPRIKIESAWYERHEAWRELTGTLPGDPDYLEHPGITPRYVWLPLLVEEFDGNEEAAAAAWVLGMRPAQYSEDSDA